MARSLLRLLPVLAAILPAIYAQDDDDAYHVFQSVCDALPEQPGY